MTYRSMKQAAVFCLALNFAGAGLVQNAAAAMIGTQDAIESEQRAVMLSEVEAALAREDVREQFIALGVEPDDVSARLAQLTDAELVNLSRRIDEMPAGASVVGVLGVTFIVLLVLEFLGITDVFKRI